MLYSWAKNYRSSAKEQTNAIKDGTRQLLLQPDDNTNIWENYFEELLSVRCSEELDVDVDLKSDPDEIIGDIRGSEILRVIVRMNIRKTGDDDLLVGIVK